MNQTIRHTSSVCPVCLKRLTADIVKAGQEYFIEKTCPEHGFFSAVVWRGENPAFETWGDYTPPTVNKAPDCPNQCGLCAGHLRKTCCALVEVTARCNLKCPVCFASSGGNDAGVTSANDPTVDVLFETFKRLVQNGNTFVQLSGGEPTVRDDLPEIVAAAKKAGCENIQLNSNGIRLGEDKAFTKALRDAGLSFVFMQFDGTADAVYEKLRGQPLLDKKKGAINACADNLLGITLVPTIVPGVNDLNIGEIVNFALSNSPAVRGVHFQPVSYFGRYPKAPENIDRITLPEILRAIEQQTGGKVKISDFAPSSCDHPRCGFHGDFVVLPNAMLLRMTSKSKNTSCCNSDGTPLQTVDKAAFCHSERSEESINPLRRKDSSVAPLPLNDTSLGLSTHCSDGTSLDDNAHLKNRNFVSRRWKRTAGDDISSAVGSDTACADYNDMDTFLSRVRSHGFTITAMAFQDAYTLDIERLQSCSLHVSRDNRMIPFCAYYITPVNRNESTE